MFRSRSSPSPSCQTSDNDDREYYDHRKLESSIKRVPLRPEGPRHDDEYEFRSPRLPHQVHRGAQSLPDRTSPLTADTHSYYTRGGESRTHSSSRTPQNGIRAPSPRYQLDPYAGHVPPSPDPWGHSGWSMSETERLQQEEYKRTKDHMHKDFYAEQTREELRREAYAQQRKEELHREAIRLEKENQEKQMELQRQSMLLEMEKQERQKKLEREALLFEMQRNEQQKAQEEKERNEAQKKRSQAEREKNRRKRSSSKPKKREEYYDQYTSEESTSGFSMFSDKYRIIGVAKARQNAKAEPRANIHQWEHINQGQFNTPVGAMAGLDKTVAMERVVMEEEPAVRDSCTEDFIHTMILPITFPPKIQDQNAMNKTIQATNGTPTVPILDGCNPMTCEVDQSEEDIEARQKSDWYGKSKPLAKESFLSDFIHSLTTCS